MRCCKKSFIIVFICTYLLLLSCDDSNLKQTLSNYQPHEGDILFQSLDNIPLVDMIKGMTRSRYAHCGIVERRDSLWYVIEPFSKVKETSIEDFIGRGVGKTVDAFRLKDEYQSKIPVLLDTARSFCGRHYDFQFQLDDKKMYCSELIYTSFKKVYGDSLGRLTTLREMNWQPYKRTIRFLSDGKIPLDRLIISPQALSEASQLYQVYKGLAEKQ